jgi:hypothetical protein
MKWLGGEPFYNRLLDYGKILNESPYEGPEYVLNGVDALGHTILCRDAGDLTLAEESRFIARRIELDESIKDSVSGVQTSLF